MTSEVLSKITVSGQKGVRLHDCVKRWEETGLKYLDNFDDAWRNLTRYIPHHGVVKVHAIKVRCNFRTNEL